VERLLRLQGEMIFLKANQSTKKSTPYSFQRNFGGMLLAFKPDKLLLLAAT
jgi:hypothetical protein